MLMNHKITFSKENQFLQWELNFIYPKWSKLYFSINHVSEQLLLDGVVKYGETAKIHLHIPNTKR